LAQESGPEPRAACPPACRPSPARAASSPVVSFAVMPRATQVLLLVYGLLEAAAAFTPSHVRGESASAADASAAAGAAARARAGRSPAAPPAAPEQRDSGSAWSFLSTGVALGLLAAALGAQQLPALAEDPPDVAHGEAVFLNNCAACHAGGNNAVQPDKKLKYEALVEYGMYDIDRIQYQVTNGKNAMPAFGERLQQRDIRDVASYVMSQADKGW